MIIDYNNLTFRTRKFILTPIIHLLCVMNRKLFVFKLK